MAEDWFIASSDAVTLNVIVKPGASSSSFVRIAEGRLTIKVAARAVEGAANQALIEFLAKELHVKKGSVTLVRGATARQKTILVAGDSKPIVARLKDIQRKLATETANEDRDS